jgi:hypothetical protein
MATDPILIGYGAKNILNLKFIRFAASKIRRSSSTLLTLHT